MGAMIIYTHTQSRSFVVWIQLKPAVQAFSDAGICKKHLTFLDDVDLRSLSLRGAFMLLLQLPLLFAP